MARSQTMVIFKLLVFSVLALAVCVPAALAQDADVSRWNGQSLSSGELAQVYGFTDVDGSRPNCFAYMQEVIEAGKPANVEGYR